MDQHFSEPGDLILAKMGNKNERDQSASKFDLLVCAKTMNTFVEIFLLALTLIIIPTWAQQNPICYLCSDGGVSNVTRPNTTIPLPEFLGFGDSVSCKQIQFAGETLRLIPPGLCALLDSREIRVACGCQNALAAGPVEVTLSPVKSPAPPNNIVGQMIRGKKTNQPSPTPSASPTASPVVKGAKQNKNGKNTASKSDSIGLDLSENEAAALTQVLRGILGIVNLLLDSTADGDIISDVPSNSPSTVPSEAPSMIPSSIPSTTPSDVPSISPSEVPSAVPSTFPSEVPSATPSTTPSSVPSGTPSSLPSSTPSELPSAFPSTIPSSITSDILSDSPSDLPSDVQSLEPDETVTAEEISFWERLIARINELLNE
jgi:hypothetical protein